MNAKESLTQDQITFCELYVNGCAPYAGNAAKCYQDVFQTDSKVAKGKGLKLLNDPAIKEYIEELETLSLDEAKEMKRFLTANLMKIVEETSTAEYKDRRGTKLSPAPLRSVAVSASKALMDMYPVKEAQKVSLEGAGEAGITFNVIVPEKNNKNNNEE